MTLAKKDVYEKGKNLILQEKYDDALKYFEELSDKDKTNANYLNYLGIVYILKEDFKKAADSFKKAIEVDPDNWYPYQRLGQICTIKKIRKCAIDYFTQTIERDPSNLYSLVNLALIVQKENQETAKDLIQSALKVDPVNLIANYLMGTICIKSCDYEKAEQMLLNVTEKNPTFQMGWYKLGVLYFKKNKLKKAIEVLTNALTISKKTYILNLLGLIHLHKLKLKEAIAYYKESIKLDSKDPSAWINLADAYLKGNDAQSAIMILKEAFDLVIERDSEQDNDKLIAIWLNLANS
jgi:tetratricopeptide (TPR) repeat protein